MPVESEDTAVPRPAFRPEELVDYELFWRNNYEWLRAHGYLLRARYEPNWKPSWEGTGKSWDECEDSSMIWVSLLKLDSFPELTLVKFSQINDATRISDGTVIALKEIKERLRQRRLSPIQQIIALLCTKCSEIPTIMNMFSSSCPSSGSLMTHASIRLEKPWSVSGNYLRYLMFSRLALISSDLTFSSGHTIHA
jgi:hypothetical protein